MAENVEEKVDELMQGKTAVEKKLTPLEEAREIMAKNEKILADMRVENDKASKMQADLMLAGKSEAGQYPPEKSSLEIAQEKAKAILNIYGK